MKHGKFHALGEQIHRQRHSKVSEQARVFGFNPTRLSEPEPELPQVSQQLTLTFEGISPVLEIYQNFDRQAREVEWSVYNSKGEFLLQFGWKLDQQEYEIHSVHPELFLSHQEMESYLEELNQRLNHFQPALELIKSDGEVGLSLRRKKL